MDRNVQFLLNMMTVYQRPAVSPATSLEFRQTTIASYDLPYHAAMIDYFHHACDDSSQTGHSWGSTRSIHADSKIATMDECHARIRILTKEDECS